VTDDPYARTAFAWARTVLGAVAVTALVVRGLVVAGLPAVTIVVAVLPAAAFLVVGASRTRVLRGHRDAEHWRPAAAAVSAALVGAVALAAIVGVGLSA
jgi:hypothetical protein